MSSRRKFIEQSAVTALALLCNKPMDCLLGSKHDDGQIDWQKIRSQYPIIHWDKIHLNSGSAGVIPMEIRDRYIELVKYLTTVAPYQAWQEWQPIKKDNLQRLGQLVGAKPEELQVVRNTTEALNMIIPNIPLQPGDEVLIADHDYPFAINAWTNRALREGIHVRMVDIPLPATHEEVVESYRSAISDKTKVIHLTHMTHREGHILPVKELTMMAHDRDIQVVVDGAHMVAHVPIDLSDLGCDYYGSSLHKWLTAPLGTGLLYVKADLLQDLHLYPSSYASARDSMDRFEHLGTRMWASDIAVGAALDYLDFIGMDRKYQRLLHLKSYWTDQVKDLNRVQFYTDLDYRYSGGIATFGIDGMPAGEIARYLDDQHQVHAKTVKGPWGSGMRISPNLFTSEAELDILVKGIKELSL